MVCVCLCECVCVLVCVCVCMYVCVCVTNPWSVCDILMDGLVCDILLGDVVHDILERKCMLYTRGNMKCYILIQSSLISIYLKK